MTPASSSAQVSPWRLSAFWFASAFHWLLLLLILMPGNVARFVGDAQKGTYLGLVVGIGAIMALVLPPIIGQYSDRIGLRMPILRWGVGVNIAGLAVMGLAATLLGGMPGYIVYTLGYVLVQIGNNAATAPYSALIPELVPQAQRGRYSGVMGQLQATGQLLGALLAFGLSMLKLPGNFGFVVVAVLLLVCAVITLRGVPEPRARAPQPGDHRGWLVRSVGRVFAVALAFAVVYGALAALIPGFSLVMAFMLPVLVIAAVLVALAAERRGMVTTTPHPQLRTQFLKLFLYQPFLWVFITRMLFSLGQYSVQPFLNYYTKDVLNQTRPDEATSMMLACIIVGSIVSALIGGRVSDRVGRKPVIYVAGGVMAVAALTLLFAPSFAAALLIALVFGLGFGAFTSVDWALGSDAMPDASTYARDMGVWHVAFVAPQLSSAPQGFLLDWGNAQGENLGYSIVFGIAAACFLLGVMLVRNIRGVR